MTVFHDNSITDRLVEALRPIEGLVALVLGGSRARGIAGSCSDYDIGLYYQARAPLNITSLQTAISPLLDDPTKCELTAFGAWGPWINGGGWLSISGCKVDFLYRDLTQVGSVIEECIIGQISMNYQPGHPHGFCSAIWMGEIALCRPLFERMNAIAELKARVWPFPQALREALIARFQQEVSFSIGNAETAIGRKERTHIVGCVYRALCCVAQVLFAVNGRYLINEKGAIAETEGFPVRVKGIVAMVDDIWAYIGAKDFHAAVDILKQIAAELNAVVGVDQCSAA